MKQFEQDDIVYVPFWVLTEYLRPDEPFIKCRVVSSAQLMYSNGEERQWCHLYTLLLPNGYEAAKIPDHVLLESNEVPPFAAKLSKWFQDYKLI